MPAEKSLKSPLLIIFSIVFIDLVGFGIVIPILPYYAQTYGASALELGWLMTTYSLMQFLVAPLWGALSDRIGRRPVLLISLLGTGISMTALGLADSLLALFIARTFAGICGANISTAYAYVTDITTEKNRAKGMGLIGAGFGLGFIFGPAIGGLLSQWGYRAPMFAGAGIAFINLVYAWFKLHEPELSPQERSQRRARRLTRANLRVVLADSRASFSVLLFFLMTFAVAQMETTFAIFMKAEFSLQARDAGMLLGLMGLIMVIFQGGLVGRLARRFGEPLLIQVGFGICAIGLALFGSSYTVSAVVVALSVLAIGHGIAHPSLSSTTSKGADASHRGAAMGIFHSMGSLARVLGPPCAGFLYDSAGPRWPFLAGAVLLAMGTGAVVVLRGKLE